MLPLLTTTALRPSRLRLPVSRGPVLANAFAMYGIRQANRVGATAAGRTTCGGYIIRQTGSWACRNIALFFPGFYCQENSNTEEALLAAAYTIEALSVTVNGVTTNASAAIGAGVTVNPGPGVRIVVPTGLIPPNSNVLIGGAFRFADGASLPAQYELRTGETLRFHASSSFASAINAGTAVSGVSGSVSGNFNGFAIGPVYVTAEGHDGTWTPLRDGDSIEYGKGTPGVLGDSGVAGILEVGFYDRGWVSGTMSIAGSDPRTLIADPTQANNRRALLALSPTLPFNARVHEGGTNGLTGTLATFKGVIKDRNNLFEGWYPGLKKGQTTLIPKATNGSTDGFRSIAGQSMSGSELNNGIRWLFNDDLVATKCDGAFDFVINTAAALSHPSDRTKFLIHPFTANLTSAYASGATVVMNAPPPIGLPICVFTGPTADSSGRIRVVTGVVDNGNGTWTVTTATGASSTGVSGGWFPAAPVGALVGGCYTADGNPTVNGLHVGLPANKLVSAEIAKLVI